MIGALSPLFNGITNIEAEDFIDFDMRDLMQGSEECQRAVLFKYLNLFMEPHFAERGLDNAGHR